MDGLREAPEPDEFEPGKAAISFDIAVDNYAAIVLAPPIIAAVARFAPGVKLSFLDLLDRNELQLVIGQSNTSAERFTRRRLTQDEYVLVQRREHR